MIEIDFSRIILDRKRLDSLRGNLSIYLKQIQDRNQGFYDILDDRETISEIQDFATQSKGLYDDIVVIGIGGSALGTQTIRDSIQTSKNINLYVVDNIDPTLIQQVESKINLSRTLFIVVTKSGGTTETISVYQYFREKVQASSMSIADHFVFITDPETGYLREIAHEENIQSFPVPKNVGGRFSVLTAVGLVPAAMIGVDIAQLIEGAKKMRALFLSTETTTNLPFEVALHQFLLGEKKQTNVVIMPYVQKLKTFSDWYKQLLAESTGKIDIHGKNTGLTPIAALGVTDQHSQLQQFTQGINDKQFYVLHQKQFSSDPLIPNMGVSFGTLLNTEMKATVDTLAEAERPAAVISFEKLDENILGQLFMLFQCATAFLGELFEINAFDQPGVERSKILTKEYLEK